MLDAISPGHVFAKPARRRIVLGNYAGFVGVTILIALALGVLIDEQLFDRAIITKLVADPYKAEFAEKLRAPSADHFLGTDLLGRDVLARLIYATRPAVVIGIGSVVLALPVGILLGISAGFYRGWIERIVMGVMDVLLTLPSILLALGMVGFLGPGTTNILIALAIVNLPAFSRLVRADAIRLRDQEFMDSARISGESDLRLMFSDLLPNCLTGLLVQVSFSAGLAIVYESGISFLGLGITPPQASWGVMLSEGRSYMANAWWLSVFPGLAILFSVLCFNLVGDDIRRRLDPRASFGS